MGGVEDDVVASDVLVELGQLLLEVQAARLVVILPHEVMLVAHLAIVATVEF